MHPTKITSIAAETHPPAYMIHKYWARKPHNVLGAIFRSMRRPGPRLFIDPFCGSGVALSEAANLGFDCLGADVNPIAVAISQFTLAPPDPNRFLETVLPHLDAVERNHHNLYSINGQMLRYAVHVIVVSCQQCKVDVASTEARRRGRTYCCPQCGDRLNFNLECLRSTRIIQLTTHTSTVLNPEICRRQEELSRSALHSGERFDREFAVNRRVLTFAGMKTHHLFTPRNFSCLAELAERFHSIEDERIKNAALILLTSAIAQCSRLVPYRNDLTTGGQAWTVPGFWVPPQHLETNPVPHVRARLKKLLRGLSGLRALSGRLSKPEVSCETATEFLRTVSARKLKADVIFLDPPYGDSVPYVEFSSMWNSFLGEWPSADEDISVTDRLPKAVAWERYQHGLRVALEEVSRILAPEGKVVVTFNNNNLKAWSALLDAIQAAGLSCSSVMYQHPAVVSTKAQLARDGSYIGDFYCTFIRDSAAPSRDLEHVTEALRIVAVAHDSLVPIEVVYRVALLTWLEKNLASDLFDRLDVLVDGLFAVEHEGRRRWQGITLSEGLRFPEELRQVVIEILHAGPVAFPSLYARVSSNLSRLGVPNPALLKRMLESWVVFDGEECIATVGSNTISPQLNLFA